VKSPVLLVTETTIGTFSSRRPQAGTAAPRAQRVYELIVLRTYHEPLNAPALPLRVQPARGVHRSFSQSARRVPRRAALGIVAFRVFWLTLFTVGAAAVLVMGCKAASHGRPLLLSSFLRRAPRARSSSARSRPQTTQATTRPSSAAPVPDRDSPDGWALACCGNRALQARVRNGCTSRPASTHGGAADVCAGSELGIGNEELGINSQFPIPIPNSQFPIPNS